MGEIPVIVPIVEGAGDKYAVPDLVRKILWQCNRYDLDVAQSVVAKGKFRLRDKFEQILRYAVKKGASAILVLLDADDKCPREEAINLAGRADVLRLQIPIAVVCAKSEYETWFICNLGDEEGTCIKERLGLPKKLSSPDNPEDIRDAKGWLRGHMSQDQAYRETADQQPLTHLIEMDLVRKRSRSFRRIWHAIEELVDAVEYDVVVVTPLMN